MLLVICGVTIAVGLFELSLRLILPEPENLAKLRFSSLFLYENKPGATFPYVREGEFNILAKINSFGFRDEEFKLAKDSGVFRIAVLGDSFEEALQVEVEDTWQKVMARKLSEKSKATLRHAQGDTERSRSIKVESYNFGVSGYGTDQEWLTLREKVWQFNPDMVILAFSPNDVGDTFKNRLVEVRNGKLEVVSAKDRVGGNFLGRLLREIYMYHLVVRAASSSDDGKRLIERIRTKVLGFSAQERFFLSDAQLAQGPFEIVASQKNPPAEVVSGWNLVRELLRDVKAQTDSFDVPLLLTVNVTRVQIDESAWVLHRDLYKLDPATSSSYEINEVLGQIASELGINFYDGRLDAAVWRAERGDLHLKVDSHYNRNGHIFMGTKVAEFISNRVCCVW